jgi:hypothetical protein
VGKNKHKTEDAQFEAFVDSVDTSGIDSLIDPEDVPGSNERGDTAALPEPWTKRGEMLPDDKGLIQAITDKNRVAARIFVTGEVSEAYIGEAAVRFLISINDTCYENGAGEEPLFIQTRARTVRMARFDPAFVWRCFHPDILVGLVRDEIGRLGVDMDPWKMDYFDFYQNMAAAMKAAHGDAAAVVKKEGNIDDFYHGVYLSCLLLFGKASYMDVPAAEHFARKEAADFLRGVEFIQLNKAGRKRHEELRKEYGSIHALTNPEMRFVVDIYEGALKWGG